MGGMLTVMAALPFWSFAALPFETRPTITRARSVDASRIHGVGWSLVAKVAHAWGCPSSPTAALCAGESWLAFCCWRARSWLDVFSVPHQR